MDECVEWMNDRIFKFHYILDSTPSWIKFKSILKFSQLIYDHLCYTAPTTTIWTVVFRDLRKIYKTGDFVAV